jgi:hypothetical protein
MAISNLNADSRGRVRKSSFIPDLSSCEKHKLPVCRCNALAGETSKEKSLGEEDSIIRLSPIILASTQANPVDPAPH